MTESVCRSSAANDGLTNIERVRLALAMADAGYEWDVELEYVEALLKAYDDLRVGAQASSSYPLSDKWRIQAQHFDAVAGQCYERGDDNEGDMNHVEASTLRRCADELAAQPPAAPVSTSCDAGCGAKPCPRHPQLSADMRCAECGTDWGVTTARQFGAGDYCDNCDSRRGPVSRSSADSDTVRLASDETKPIVETARELLRAGINIQATGDATNAVISGLVEKLLAHIDDLDADLKCSIALGRAYAARSGAQPQAAPVSELKGTFSCPICGKDTPHHHTPQEVESARKPTIAEIIADCRKAAGHYRKSFAFGTTMSVDSVAEIYDRIAANLERATSPVTRPHGGGK